MPIGGTRNTDTWLQQFARQTTQHRLVVPGMSGIQDATILDTDVTNPAQNPPGQARVVVPSYSPSIVIGPAAYPGTTAPPDGVACTVSFVPPQANSPTTLTVRILTIPGYEGDAIDPYLVNTVPSSGTHVTLSPLAQAIDNEITLSANCNVTMPAPVAGGYCFVTARQASSGGSTLAFSNVVWAGNEPPTMTSTASAIDRYGFWSDGFYWYGYVVGQNYLPSTNNPVLHVQDGATNTGGNGQSSGSAASVFSADTTMGNTIVVFIAPGSGTLNVVSALSGLGVVAWARAYSQVLTPGFDFEVWYGRVTTTGTETLTVTTSDDSVWFGYVSEWSTPLGGGLVPVMGFSQGGSGESSTGTITTPSITAGNVAIAAILESSSGTITDTPGTPWTTISLADFSSAEGGGAAYYVSTATGTQDLSWTYSQSTNYGVWGCIFFPQPDI